MVFLATDVKKGFEAPACFFNRIEADTNGAADSKDAYISGLSLLGWQRNDWSSCEEEANHLQGSWPGKRSEGVDT